MAGDVHGHHGNRGRDLVEVFAGGVTAEQGIVVASAENPAGELDIRLGGEGLQSRDEIIHRVDGAVGRSEQEGADRLAAKLLGVGMAIDEAGHERLPGQVHRSRLCPPVGLLDLGPRAERQNRPVLDRQGLGAGLGVIHSDDATDVDRIRHDGWGGGRVSRGQNRKAAHHKH